MKKDILRTKPYTAKCNLCLRTFKSKSQQILARKFLEHKLKCRQKAVDQANKECEEE